MGVSIPWISERDLRKKAQGFLAAHDPANILPVPIEWIAESDYKLDIVPVDGLLSVRGINGYVCADRNTLYVDKWVYERVETRYRFTIAHELAHLELHPEHYRQFKTPEDWIAFHRDLPEAELTSAEWQANTYAGLVLVPEASLLQVAKTCFDQVAAKVLATAPQFDLTSEAFWETVAFLVAQAFGVHQEAARIRIQRDAIWGRRL